MTYDVSDSDPRVISLSLISDPVGRVPGDQLVINFNSGHIHPTSLPSDLFDLSLCTTRFGCQPYSVHVPVGRWDSDDGQFHMVMMAKC